VTTPTQPAKPSGGGGNVFQRKIGPLAMWVWMVLALLLALAFYLYRKNAAGSSSNTSGAGSSPSTVNTPGGVDSSLVPQFVNQTYVQGTPPAAPATATTTVSKTNSTADYSVTSQGNQTLAQMAQTEGVSTAAFGGTNAAAKTFLSTTYKKNPKAIIPKGAKFDYSKEPDVNSTTTTTTK
jgi:hypothetical protein